MGRGGSLDPRPSDLCILMEGLVRDGNRGRTDLIGQATMTTTFNPQEFLFWSEVKRLANDC